MMGTLLLNIRTALAVGEIVFNAVVVGDVVVGDVVVGDVVVGDFVVGGVVESPSNPVSYTCRPHELPQN